MILNNNKIKTLESFRTYRYLTARQMVKLGIYKTEKGLRDKILSKLKAKPYPLIKSVDFGFVAGKGRLPQLHYLTKRGALTLADLHGVGLDEVPYPIGAVQFSRDYFHRTEFISLHIALRQYAEATGQEVEFFHSYFDSTGNQRQKNSQLVRDTQVQLNGETIIPDGNFRLAMSDGQKRLFTLELHKGTNTKKIIAQLENHARIIEEGLLADKYQHPYDNYVLSVYDHEGTMKAVQRRFDESPLLSHNAEHFGFNTSQQVQKSFPRGWQYNTATPYRILIGH